MWYPRQVQYSNLTNDYSGSTSGLNDGYSGVTNDYSGVTNDYSGLTNDYSGVTVINMAHHFTGNTTSLFQLLLTADFSCVEWVVSCVLQLISTVLQSKSANF